MMSPQLSIANIPILHVKFIMLPLSERKMKCPILSFSGMWKPAQTPQSFYLL